MEVPLEIHPFEVGRRLRLFWENMVSDFGLRHSDTRKRLAYELKLDLPKNDAPLFQKTVDDFIKARGLISSIDWPILFEWNEALQQAQTLSKISRSLEYFPRPKEAKDFRSRRTLAILERLDEIQNRIRQMGLPYEASWLELVSYRWRSSAQRDEANFLLSRLEEIRQHSTQ